MRAKLIHEQEEKTFALVFDPGDEVMEELTNFAKENGLNAAHFTAIGAFSDATLGYFDMEKKEYKEIPVDEQVEVLSLVGDIALFEGEPKLHAHAVSAGPTERRGAATFSKPTSNRPWRSSSPSLPNISGARLTRDRPPLVGRKRLIEREQKIEG